MRREGDRATAEAEEMAQEATITSAALDPGRAAGAARGTTDDDMNAAFRLEQSDYRIRLQIALDQLDQQLLRSRPSAAHASAERPIRDLRARRARLRADLDAVDRSTEQDWATLRTRLERDLEEAP